MAEYQSSLTADEKNLSFNRQRDAVPELLVKSAAHGYYELDPQAQRSAGFLSVVVIIVLLIVCANVANLLLSRATTRHREISVRLSMGATGGRLARQLLTESLLLSSLGGTLGVLVGYWSRSLLPFGQNAPLDWRVFGFVAGVSMLTGVVFGLLPALRATHVDLSGAFKETSRSVTGSRSMLSKALLVPEVAMSLVLLVGAGLFLRTFDNLKSVDVGFNSTNLLMFNVNPSVNRYDIERSAQVFRQVLERMSSLPGVRSAALTRTMWKQGQTSQTAAEEEMYMMDVSPTFFATMGIHVLRGRGFNDHDDIKALKVAIINEASARKLFPDGNVLGRRIGGSFEKSNEFEIVGVVRDTKYASVRDPGPPTMYRCALQGPARSLNVVLRTVGDPLAMTETVRAAMREVDPTLPIQRFTSQSEQISLRFAHERLFATAYTAFGALALVLACIGLFGLMSYNVARRTNEIGIRMALGAQRGTVVGMVMAESMLLVGVGVALGLAAALWTGRFVKTVLYGLSASDPLTITAAVALIAVVSALAGYLPARRASNVDPMESGHRIVAGRRTLLCGDGRSSGNHDPGACGRVGVALGRELSRQVLAEVDRSGERTIGERAREDEGDGVARPSLDAPQRHLVPFDHADQVANGEVPLVRALNPVAILLDVQAVLAAAAEELDVDVPAPAEVRGGSGHLGRPRRTRAREHFMQTAGDDLVLARLHLPGRDRHACRPGRKRRASAVAADARAERDPRLRPGELLGQFLAGHVQLRGVPQDLQRRALV